MYVGFEEFKGRRLIERGSERFATHAEDFDNPFLEPDFELRTSGSSGPENVVRLSLEFVADQAVNQGLVLRAHGLERAQHAIWMPAPVFQILRYARLGRPPVAWFHPVQPLPWRVRFVGWFLRVLGAFVGCALPAPVWVELSAPGRLIDWLVERLADGQPLCLTTYASQAVRVAHEARRQGRSLDGLCFICIGEPFTEAKHRVIAASGARAIATYSSTETGVMASRCVEPRGADDLHVYRDSFALIQRRRLIGDLAVSVPALHLTSPLASAPKIMLNVETGDHGTLERRDCACGLGALGLRDHLSGVRSHEKLTGEGMTFLRTTLLQILEETLPRRFGGTAGEYQLVEEEDADGILRLSLLVSPTIESADEETLRQAFLGELSRRSQLEKHMAAIWERAGTLRVRRETPRLTTGGKVQPFRPLGSPRTS